MQIGLGGARETDHSLLDHPRPTLRLAHRRIVAAMAAVVAVGAGAIGIEVVAAPSTTTVIGTVLLPGLALKRGDIATGMTVTGNAIIGILMQTLALENQERNAIFATENLGLSRREPPTNPRQRRKMFHHLLWHPQHRRLDPYQTGQHRRLISELQ